MSRNYWIGASAMVTIGLSAPSAWANDIFEDEIIVTAQYLSLDKVNAVKTPTPIIDIPQSLTIISADTIREQAFFSIGDITRFTPGVNISQGEGHRDAIIIRGNQTTADFFQDGLRDDVQYYRPLYNLERVEILRGANALLFGRGGVGGIINRVTKKAQPGEQFTALTASVDTFGAYYGAVDSNVSLSENLGFRVNGFYEGLNNHRDVFDGERFGINPTLGFEFGPDTSIDLSYEYLDDDRIVDRGVPSVPRVGADFSVPLRGVYNTFFGAPDGNDTTLQAHILRAQLDRRFNDTLRGNVSAQFADYDKAYRNLYPAGFDPNTQFVTLDGYRDLTDRQNLLLQANLVGEFATGPIGHTLLFGAEYANQDTQNARFDNLFPSTNDDQASIPLTDPLTIPAFGYTDLSRDRDSDVNVLSVYIQDQLDLTDRFKIVLGARFDRFDIDVFDAIEAGDGDAVDGNFARVDEEITPRLGAIYKPLENVSLYASYSETFVPRSGDQFLTLNLDTESTRPQFTENLEAGLKWDIRPGLSLTTAVFELDRENFTSIDPDDQTQLITIAGAKTTGFETQLSGSLTDRWTVNAGYSYLDGEVQGGGFDGNEPRQTPEHMISLWNSYQVDEKIGLALGATYQDSYFVREDNATRVPDYVRFDAAAFYDVSDTLRLQVNVENLLDTDYYPDAHSNDNISTGKPLNARFTVSNRF